ncbi:two-component system response regulator [Tepidamorphus sp. 3E244]|uniref:response regulator n=1 Tax=Tepidamorphus sp. 3E244 TaxID=3385498 RepID=UPI0038FC26B7
MSEQPNIPAGAHALVINDSAFACQLLSTMLRQIGFDEVESVDNWRDGVHRTLETAPALVLLNWSLPEKCGADVLHLLKACDHPFEYSPVMVTSNAATRDAIVASARANAAGFIVQPFAQKTLATRVARILGAVKPSARTDDSASQLRHAG